MTIQQAIDRADKLSSNTYAKDQKIAWLSTLDNLIYTKDISTHHGADIEEFNGHDNADDELLVGEPYTDMYIYWLLWHYALHNEELVSYNNYVFLYNELYDDFSAWYNREHMPKQTAREVFF